VHRRHFIKLLAASSVYSNYSALQAGARGYEDRLLFTSQGKTGFVRADGSGLHFLQLTVPAEVTWQPVDFFRDGLRVLMMSMEERRDGPGRPFSDYYHLTPTHMWIYYLGSGELREIEDQHRLAPFYAPLLILPGENRIVVQVITKGAAQLFTMNLDGTDRREFTRAGEGFPYGLSVSPDGSRVAFHVSGPPPYSYRIFTADLDGSNRQLVAGNPDHLYFGTSWSPDSKWILYHDVHFKTDPGHDWADICIGRPEGPEHRVLTQGAIHWASAVYGNSKNFRDGSNMPQWMPGGRILFSRKLPGSRTAWEFDPKLPDDHFRRLFKPELATGGTELCLLDPGTGSMQQITKTEPPQWNFRARPSPDGKQIVFCRAKVGDSSSIWVVDSDGTNERVLAHGFQELGADQPRWLPRSSRRLG
jgi:Tol biopolymer transport system component